MGEVGELLQRQRRNRGFRIRLLARATGAAVATAGHRSYAAAMDASSATRIIFYDRLGRTPRSMGRQLERECTVASCISASMAAASSSECSSGRTAHTHDVIFREENRGVSGQASNQPSEEQGETRGGIWEPIQPDFSRG